MEFTEWIAFWSVEAELSGSRPESEREPTREELGAKIEAWVARHNAAQKAKR